MIVKKCDAPHERVHLDIELSAEEVQESIKKALQQEALSQDVDGVPEAVDLKAGHIDYDDVRVQNYLKHLLVSPLEKELCDLQTPSPVTRPVIIAKEDIAADKGFVFTISYMPLPQLDLTSYEPVAIEIPDSAVSEQEVADALEGLLKSNAALCSDAEGTPVSADKTVEVSIDAKREDGSPYFGLSSQRRQYRIGEGFLPDEFDAALLGMTTGETKSFSIDVPVVHAIEDEVCETTAVEMTVTVLKVMSEKPPAMTDAWVHDNVPGFNDVEGLRAYVKDTIHLQKEEKLESVKMRQAVDVLKSRLSGSISDDFFEAQYKESCFALDEALRGQDMTREQFYEKQGIDEQRFRMMSMMEIRDRFSQVFALDAYARKLGLEASDADVEDYLAALSSHDAREAAQVREMSYTSSLKEAVCRSWAMKALLNTASVIVKA